MSTVIAATNTSMMNARSSPVNALNSCVTMDGKHPDQTTEECSICYEIVTDKAFVNDCLHYFCYKCIKQWISVRAVCPLCVQPIESIINNVRSVDDYDLLTVQPPEKDVLSNWDDTNDVDLWEMVEDEYDELNEMDFFQHEQFDWIQDEEYGSDYGSNIDFDSDDDLEDCSMSEENPEEEPEEEEEEPLEDTDGEISDVEENPSESENEEAKSSRSDIFEMEDDIGFDNYCESEYEECENDSDNSSNSSDDHSNSSDINSEGNNDEPDDYSYDNFYNDSEDNNSLPDCDFENYHESLHSYETHTDDSDVYDSFDDLFDDY